MKHPTLILGILIVMVIGALFLGAPSILAATGGTTPTPAAATVNVGGSTIPLIPGNTDARPYFNLMMNTPGQQGFIIASNAGTDFAQQYLMVEAGDNDHQEADMYVKIGTTYKLMDCEQGWYTFASTALDYSSYAGYITPVTFDNVIASECQKDDATGNYTAEQFASNFASGKTALGTLSAAAPASVDAPGAATTPTTGAASTVINASDPAPSEFCDLSAGTNVQYVKMGTDMTSDEGLGTAIPATSTSEYAKQPQNIVYTDPAGKAQYLLQIWHFSTDELIAQSVLNRATNVEGSMWEVLKESALQGVDNLLWFTPVDVGHPLDAAKAVVTNYNAQFPDQSAEVSTSTISLLPGFGKLAVGARLCVFEDGNPKSYWGKVSFKKDSPMAIPNALTSLGYTATFLPTNNQKGKITIHMGVYQSPVPGSTDQITYANIDTTADKSKAVFRFRLSDDTLQGIIAGDSTLSNGGNTTSLSAIQSKMNVTLVRKSDGKKIELALVRDLEGLMFGTNSLKYFTSAPILEPATGRPTKIDTSNAFYPDTYTLIVHADGYKDYRTDIAVTPSMLSGSDTSAIKDADVFKLSVKGMKITKNCATTCTDLLSCLACLDSGLVEGYSSTIKSK